MLYRLVLCAGLLWPGVVLAADVVDATGRTVTVPDHIVGVLPAGPPAAVLLAAIAPDLMLGWPGPLSDQARAYLDPSAAKLPVVPRLTGREDVTAKVQALHPDLILDYGTISPRYADLARTTQQHTGIPTILLDGALPEIPAVLRSVGKISHREARAETLATLAEAILALPLGQDHPHVLYARGPDGLAVAASGTDVTAVFDRLGWQVVAPSGEGTFRFATVDEIRTLDPDIVIFADPAMREGVMHDPAWRSVRAVQSGHALISPAMPFGWVEEPPSINRLLGLAWLEGRDPVTIASLFYAVVYGHALTPAQLDSVKP